MIGISCVVTGCGSGEWICRNIVLFKWGERWRKKRVRGIGEGTKTRKTKRKREINKILAVNLRVAHDNYFYGGFIKFFFFFLLRFY